MFDVLLGGQSVGQAQVEKQGMYYRIHCRCRLSGEVAYKVQMEGKDNTHDLGLLVPENGAFCLTTRIPIKQAGDGQLRFTAIPRGVKLPKNFVAIRADEPFAYLANLENAYLSRQNGVTGICFQD